MLFFNTKTIKSIITKTIKSIIMKTIKTIILLLIFTVFNSNFTFAQDNLAQSDSKEDKTLKTYLIERDIPDAGKFTTADLVGISKKSCSVLDEMGSENIQWLHSYVTENKIYCIYKARNKELLREHAAKGGFPANVITELATIISPETAK